jgi:hypothetical protein
LTDKGYDAQANRRAARARHICPVIPHRSNAASRPSFFPGTLYQGWVRIEQTMGKLKRFKRIALRCEKTAENYAAFVAFACGAHPHQMRPHGLVRQLQDGRRHA